MRWRSSKAPDFTIKSVILEKLDSVKSSIVSTRQAEHYKVEAKRLGGDKEAAMESLRRYEADEANGALAMGDDDPDVIGDMNAWELMQDTNGEWAYLPSTDNDDVGKTEITPPFGSYTQGGSSGSGSGSRPTIPIPIAPSYVQVQQTNTGCAPPMPEVLSDRGMNA